MNQKEWFVKQIFLILFFCGFVVSVNAKTQVEKLVCEYHENPLGIDVKDPRLSWQIRSDQDNFKQTAYEIRVAETITDLNKKNSLIWSSGKVVSPQSVNVFYEGPELKSKQRVYWQIRVWGNDGKVSSWSEPAFWEMGMLTPDLWRASWITRKDEPQIEGSLPVHYYRHEFFSDKKVSSARVYVTSLGLYEIFINGERIGNQLFTPGWTSYNKRLQYQTYDVTNMIHQKNAIGAVVGDGWYRGNIGFTRQSKYYGDKIALLVQLEISYTDGSKQVIVSDNSWKVTTGPILESDIYNGEIYDANLEMEGWSRAGFDDNAWKKVAILDHSKDILIAPQGEPVKAIEEIKPVKSLTTPSGEMVIDMGQNMVGWVNLKLQGTQGDTIRLKFAEVLDKNGNFYTDNLRAAKATDTYILKGNGEEIFEPNFTFHGFRYVKIEGMQKAPELDQITGVVIHSAVEPTGSFSCSDPLINQLQHNIQWGQRGNFLDVPTDCPQRDERLGWTGDAQVFSPTAAFNFEVASFFTKWMKDLAADQLPNGVVPHVIPDVLNGNGGSTAWADASIVVPWNTYLAYGDKRILQVQYPSMKAWVEYMRGRAGEDKLWTGDTHYGDWLAYATTQSDYPGATTEKDLIATAYYSYSTGLLAKIAGIIGKEDDAQKYNTLSNEIKKAFVHEFVTPSGRLVSHTQTAYCLALSFNLLPDDLVQNAAEYLAEDVKKMGHLTTGFVGTPLLCKTLSDYGYEDLAFMLLNRKEYPSWLYPVTQGATTIWERWDGQKPDGTFQSEGMNSFNHYAYGAIGEWLYTYVAGLLIDPEEPGYKHFILSPHPGGGLTNADLRFKSLYGTIGSSWKIENNQMIYNVNIPENTSATVVLPDAVLENVSMNSSPLKGLDKNEIQTSNGVSLELGSGSYDFVYPI